MKGVGGGFGFVGQKKKIIFRMLPFQSLWSEVVSV
jgi:hypothetical protein